MPARGKVLCHYLDVNRRIVMPREYRPRSLALQANRSQSLATGRASRRPPGHAIQASTVEEIARNGNPNDQLNDVQSAQYVPHENDPELWSQAGMAQFQVYGPREIGPTFHQGEGDERAISPNDVHQGKKLGNCFFMSALAGVAKYRPELIENAIEGPLADGTYNVTLFSSRNWDEQRENKPITINISPSFVVYGNFGKNSRYQSYEGRALYSNHADRDEHGNMELWVKLLEKAHAKLFGGWEKVDGGWPMIVLEMLTGESYVEQYFNGVPERLSEMPRENFTRASSQLNRLETAELKAMIIGDLEAGYPVTAEDATHAVTVWSANEESITLRDQAKARGENEGLTTYSWEDFRAQFVKISCRMNRPD